MGKSKEIAELAGHFNVSSTEAVTAADLTVTGDLTVNGTNTTINSATLTVDDKNIVVAQGSADAAAADGAGLTVDGASATLTYASTGDKFVFNKQVDSTVIRATSATSVSLSSTGHGFQVGADNTANIAIDNNEVQARNNGSTGSLYLNSQGGPVYLGPITGRTILASNGLLTQYGTSTGATTFDPILKLQRSPSDNSVTDGDYLGALTFAGKDSANNATDYSTWAGRAELTSNGSEEGTIEQYGLKSGTSTHMASFGGNKWQLRSDQTIQWFEHNGTTYDVTLAAATPSIDRTITLPNETGTVVLAETDTNFLSDVSITSGTDAKVTINDNIGEVGAGNIAFQASNSAGSALKPMGLRAEDIRFATGSAERMRIENGGLTLYSNIGANSSTLFASMDGRIGFDTDYSDSARGPNKILLQNDGNWISGLGISNNYLDIYSGGNIAFHRSTGPDAYTNNMTIQYDGNVGIGIVPATSAGANFARLVIDSDSNNYPKSLEINAVNPAGPNFAISSYSDGSGSYYLLGANLSYQTNGNFAWETNGENMAGISLDSRAGHGVTFIDSYYDGSSAYVPAEIGKVHTSIDSRADITVDATGLAGDGGTNANAFFNAKAKGYYYAGLEILSNDGHVGGWIGHHNGSSTARNLQARVGGTGINASDYQAIYADYLGRVTHPQRPHFVARAFTGHQYVNSIQASEDSRLRGWKHIDVNRGSHFDNTTGKFTCPIAGDYIFYCNVMFTNPNTMDFHLGFKKNGTVVTYSNDHNGGGSGQGHNWNGTTLTISGYFNANDYVGFGVYGSGSTSTTYLYGSSSYCIMGGHLL